MYADEATIKITSKVMEEYPEVEPQKIKGILESVLSEYELQPMSTALTVQDNLQERIMIFLASKKIDGLSIETLKSYRLHLMRFSNYIKKNAEDITTMDLRMFLAVLSKNFKLKDTSLETEKSILKSFFNWLEQEDYIKKSPAKKLKPTKIDKKLRGSLTIEEMEILKESCKTLRERAMIEFFYCTGCRLDEVAKLNRNDIDWQNMCLKVMGKGSKERIVMISPKAKIHLQKYLMSRLDDNGALFVSERNPHGRLGRRAFEKEIKKIGLRAGLTKNVFPHLIRHTTATVMINNGADITAIQNLLGHSTPATTQVYIDVSNQYVKDQYTKHFVQ